MYPAPWSATRLDKRDSDGLVAMMNEIPPSGLYFRGKSRGSRDRRVGVYTLAGAEQKPKQIGGIPYGNRRHVGGLHPQCMRAAAVIVSRVENLEE